MPEHLEERKDQVKTFSEELDRQLAGLPASPGRILDKGLTDTLEFARKLSVLRSEPSPEFQASLKARLLNMVAQAEEKKRLAKPWWLRYTPQKPLWQAAAAVAVVLLVVGIVWASGAFRSQPSPIVSPPPGTTSAPGKYVQASASTNKAVYDPGEEVDIHITLENISPESLTIDQYPPILSLMRSSTAQPVYTFGAGTGARTLAPGQSISYTQVWNQIGFDGLSVPAGTYSLELEDIEFQGQAIKLTLVSPVKFEILGRTSERIPSNIPYAKFENRAGQYIRPATVDLLSRLFRAGL
jgi:hypothetical protein